MVFGNAGLLEIKLVELGIRRSRHEAGRARIAARPERHAEADDGVEAVQSQQRRIPGDDRAPVVADDDGGGGFKGVEKAHHVADQMKKRVLVDRFGPIALAVAPHVGGDCAKARRRKRAQLMAPGIPGFGKAVAQKHRGPIPVLRDVEADAVGLNHSLCRFAHDRFPCWCFHL